MSDLSRLRARWIRLEKRIAQLEAQRDNAFNDEADDLNIKLATYAELLTVCIADVNQEELRLMAADAKLHFTPRGLPKVARRA